MGLTLASGRSPREGNGSPLQCPCLEDHMDRGAWWDYFRKSRMPPHCNEAMTPPVWVCILYLSLEANITYDFYTPFPLTKITLSHWLRLQNIIVWLMVFHSSAFTGLIFLFKNYIYGLLYIMGNAMTNIFMSIVFFMLYGWIPRNGITWSKELNVFKVLDKYCLLPLNSILIMCVTVSLVCFTIGSMTEEFGLPRWLSGRESACQCRRHRFNPRVGKIL